MSVELIIATFEKDETKAGQFLKRAIELDKSGTIKLENAASIVKTKDGQVKVEDIYEFEPKSGAKYGAITGAILGLIGGPVGVGLGTALGAAAGAGLGKIADRGVSNKLIKSIQKGLQPGSSALVAYAELSMVNLVIERLEEAGGTVSHETMDIHDVSDLV